MASPSGQQLALVQVLLQVGPFVFLNLLEKVGDPCMVSKHCQSDSRARAAVDTLGFTGTFCPNVRTRPQPA